jgi:hypothetical protein
LSQEWNCRKKRNNEMEYKATHHRATYQLGKAMILKYKALTGLLLSGLLHIFFFSKAALYWP